MSNDLFGIDIAGIIADNITSSDVMPATLTQKSEGVPDPTDLTGPPTTTATEYPCRGFTGSLSVEDATSTDVLEDDRKVSLIGNSLPAGIVPAAGDDLVIQDNGTNVSFEVLGLIERDPAAAIYTLHVRR